MSSITYTALRDLERAGYEKSGTDISVAAADDSFNSVSTNLSGLLDNQWVLVAGFVNAVNNGYFQLSANSTSTKISQDTTTSLVTEAAGPPISLIGFKRGPNQAYSMDFGVERADRTGRIRRSSHQPIGGGAPETLFYHQQVVYRIRTGAIAEANIPQWHEFFGSVMSGEIFIFDRYGTAASPVEPKQAILESDDISDERDGPLYPGRYRFSFDVRILN